MTSSTAPLEMEQNLARLIDHTLLRPDATLAEIKTLCEEAARFKFATVCVNSVWVSKAAQLLEGSGVLPIAVVGFPLGACSSDAKAAETRNAVQAGAKEIDMVIQIGALKGRDYTLVFNDIKAVVEAAKPLPVKVILETCSLSDEEKIIACALAKAAGAAFVKTSTGFGTGGATVSDIELMRRIVGPEMGVKASGGIRTREIALKMLQAGANRIGASASVAIVQNKAPESESSNVKKY